MIGLVNANLAVSIMEDNDTLLSYQNIIKKNGINIVKKRIIMD